MGLVDIKVKLKFAQIIFSLVFLLAGAILIILLLLILVEFGYFELSKSAIALSSLTLGYISLFALNQAGLQIVFAVVYGGNWESVRKSLWSDL